MTGADAAPDWLFQTDDAAEYYFEEGCYILELLNDSADPAVSIARARVPAGVTTRWHALSDTVERYLIQAGKGVVEVGESPPQTVMPGQVVVIGPDERQRIHNPGPGDLVFLAICTPRFRPENYRDIED